MGFTVPEKDKQKQATGFVVPEKDRSLPSMTVAEQPKPKPIPTEQEIDKASSIWSNITPAYQKASKEELAKIPKEELTPTQAKEKYAPKAGIIDPLEPITNWAMEFVEKTGTALGEAGEKFKAGIGTLLEATSDVRASSSPSRGETLVKGGLQTATGVASTAFNVIPAAVTFNAGVDAINTAAKKNLSEENAKAVETATSVPFTLFSRLTDAMGLKPEEGSNVAMASELFDLILAGKVIHSTIEGKRAIEGKIKSVADLKEMSKKASENGLNEQQLKEYKDYVESLKTVTAEDIKNAAIGKNTPESLALAKKIEELTSPTLETTERGMPRVLPPTAEKLAEAEKLKEESLTTFEMTPEGIPRVLKPTQEEINLAFKEKAEEQSKNVFDAIKSGEADVDKLKSSLDFARDKGKITPEEHALANQKIDTYTNYFEITKDVQLTDEAKRNVFDLAWTNENVRTQITAIEEQMKVKPSEFLDNKRETLENIHRQNSKIINQQLEVGVVDQFGVVAPEVNARVIDTKIEADNTLSVEERNFAKQNAKSIAEKIGKQGKKTSHYYNEEFKAEAKKQFWKEQPENIAKVDKMFAEGKEVSDKVWEAEMERQWKESQGKEITAPEIVSNPPTAEHKILHEYIDTKLPGKNFNNLADVNNSAKADLIVEHMLENNIRILKGGVIEVGEWAKKTGVKGNLLPHYYDVDFGGKKVKFASSEHTTGMKERNLQGRKVDVQLVLPEDANLQELVKQKIIDPHELVEMEGKPVGFKFKGSEEVYPHILVAREVMPDGTTGKKIANLVSSDFSEFIKKKAGREGVRVKKPVTKEDIVNPPKEPIVSEKKIDVEAEGLEKDIAAESEGARVPTVEERDAMKTFTEESVVKDELLNDYKLYEDEQQNRETIEELPDRDSSEQEPIIKSIEEAEIPKSDEVRNKQVKVAEEYIEKVKRKVSGQLNFQFAKAMKHDVTTPYDQVLQYFIGGGKINAEAIKKLFGGPGKEGAVKSESKLRKDILDDKALKNATDSPIEKLGEDLAASQKNEGQYDSVEFAEAISDVLLEHNNRTSMAKKLNESFAEKDTRNIDTSKVDDESPAASNEGKSAEDLANEAEIKRMKGEEGEPQFQKPKGEVSPETIKAREKKIAQLKKAIPGLEVVYDESIGKDIAGQLDADGKTVRLNPNYNYADTPIHEFGHALIDILGGTSNALIKKGVEQLRNTELWKETAERYPELSPDMLAKEVLAEAIGREGAKIFETKEAQSKFKNFLDGLFYKIKRALGIDKNVAKNLANKLLKGGKLAEVKPKETKEKEVSPEDLADEDKFEHESVLDERDAGQRLENGETLYVFDEATESPIIIKDISEYKKISEAYPDVYSAIPLIEKGGIGETQFAKAKSTDPYELSRHLKGQKLAKAKYRVSDKIASAKGFTRDMFELVSTTLNNIHPELKGALRNYQLDLKNSMDKDLVPAKAFLTKIKEMRKMSKADFSDFDFARKNGDTKKINALLKKYGMEKEYKDMVNAIEAIDERASALDLATNFKVGDNPVRVKDYKGLMKYVEKELGTDAKSIREDFELREAYLERPMTEEEMGEMASEIIRKRATKNVPYITPEMEKFYDSADDALINYISSMNLKISTREFAGLGDAEKGFETTTGTMWKKANELLSKGEITADQYNDASKVITAYFNKGETNRAISMAKNIGFIDVMGNVSSALGQIGDIGFAMYKFGPGTTLKEFGKSIAGKSEIKAQDVISDDIVNEYGHTDFTSQKAVKSIFRWAGLEKMEKLSNETIVNSHIAKMRKDAMRLDKMGRYDKKAFMDKIEGYFEPAEVKQVIKDLVSGKKTDNVIKLAYNGILDLKPIGKSEVPLKYLENPNGRVMYSLKLYTLKSIDILRNEIGKDLVSKDPKAKARGVKNLILLSSSLALMGGTMDEIRDYLGNKKSMSLSDRIFYSYLKTIGINSYMVGSAKKEGLPAVLAKQVTPSILFQPFKILQDVYDDVAGAHKGKTLTHLPIFGKLLYENLQDKK
jgi:hypothetical protein